MPEFTPEQWAAFTKVYAAIAPSVMLIIGLIMGHFSDRRR